jgi:cytochrome P450
VSTNVLYFSASEDRRDLRDVFINMLVAGRDTTSQTMSWCLFFLAKHPDVQTRLREEIQMHGSASPQFKEHTDGALPFLNAVLKETLRLTPPVPVDVKGCIKDDVLPVSCCFLVVVVSLLSFLAGNGRSHQSEHSF